ncbi:zinc finger matrin-type protein 4-like isoform X2 [Rhinatrema bivittatum]|nr:zinc finger matrin-type protein 4-like isoform X2 [Rhinatrema bivittatum]
MLHPEDGGPPSKKLRPDDPESDETEVDKNKCCTLCNMFFTSAIVAESHYQGKTHAKRLKLVLGESPSKCIPTDSTQDHPEEPEINLKDCDLPWAFTNGSDSGKFCNLCRAWFNNPSMAQQHYEGKKHKKNAARAKLLQRLGETLDSEALEALRSSYTCNTCNVVLNSIEQYHAHLQGARHQNNIQGSSSDEIKQPEPNVLQPPSAFCTGREATDSSQKRWDMLNRDSDSGRSSPTPSETQRAGDGAACFQESSLLPRKVATGSNILY